tara:strand:+ start:11212 stop:11673 length:462 start_codon:yes stop_codon:yes gene_type:complete
MDVLPHHTPEEVVDLIANCKDTAPRIARRFRGVLLAMQGHSLSKIGEQLGVSTKTVLGWIQHYNYGGLPGLLGNSFTSPMKYNSLSVVAKGLEELIKNCKGGMTLEDITAFVMKYYNPSATLASVCMTLNILGLDLPKPTPTPTPPKKTERTR